MCDFSCGRKLLWQHVKGHTRMAAYYQYQCELR